VSCNLTEGEAEKRQAMSCNLIREGDAEKRKKKKQLRPI
jgi:hypothetical protein